MIDRILIVDDEPEIVREIGEYLQSTGRHVETACSKQSAVQKLVRDSEIKLVLSDVRMPGGDGHSLLAFVREELGSTIPFVLMTGQAACPDRRGAPQPTAILAKPVRLRELGSLFEQLETTL